MAYNIPYSVQHRKREKLHARIKGMRRLLNSFLLLTMFVSFFTVTPENVEAGICVGTAEECCARGEITGDQCTAPALGLVPVMCQNPQTCGTCEFVELINNVISFLITFASIAATLLIMYAGFKLVTSGGNVSAKGFAKSMITSVLIGYVLILAAFLIVNTALGVLLPGNSTVLGWQRIECLYPTEPQMVRGGYGEQELPAQYYDEDGYIGFSDQSTGMGSARACEIPMYGSCSLSNLQAAGFGSQAGNAAMIAGAESGCNPSAESRTDTTTDGRTYSVGTWQINMSVHNVSCGGTTLNCPAAFRDAGTRNRYNVKEKVVVNEALYQQCLEALKDPQCNNQIAAGLANRSGDMGDWACSARKCGVSTTRNHLCPL